MIQHRIADIVTLAIMVAGSIAAEALGAKELALIFAGAAGGSIIPRGKNRGE